MNKNKQNLIERLFFNNKFLMVFSVLTAIVLWAVVKINYSETTTRVFNELSVTVDDSAANVNDFTAYYKDGSLKTNITVSGRAYNINTYSLKDTDISVKATSGYITKAGKQRLNITAEVDKTGVKIVKVEPKTLDVFFDKPAESTFNVTAELTNKDSGIVADGYKVEQIMPNYQTITVSGPATILNKIKSVKFRASIDESDLPLTAQKDLSAKLVFDGITKEERELLDYDQSKEPGVTVLVYREVTVPTEVKFVNQPKAFADQPPKYRISPANVKLKLTDKGEEESQDVNSYVVGTIDFSTLKSGLNVITFEANKTDSSLVEEITEFKVTVDLSSMSSLTVNATQSKVVFQPQSEDLSYKADLSLGGFNKVRIIGPASSLKRISEDDLQIIIDVSSLSQPSQEAQSAGATVTVQSDDVTDCWVYGAYKAKVLVSAK